MKELIDNKIFGTTLLIITVILFFSETPFQIFGISVTSLANITWTLKIISLLLLCALTFGLYEKITEEHIINKARVLFRSKIQKYIKARDGKKIEDLKKLYPQVSMDKNIYFIEGNFILKTTDGWIDGNYQPNGFILKTTKTKYYWLIVNNAIKAILNFKIFPYAVLLSWSLILGMVLIVEFYFHLHGWL